MSAPRVGGLLVVAGTILLAVSALADPFGIGGADGFGWKQVVGAAVGAVVAAVGVLLARRRAPAT